MVKSNYSGLFLSETPQNKPLPNRPGTGDYQHETKQVENNAGGYVFALDKFDRLERFLILGSDAPTYYASPQKLTKENASVVNECWNASPEETALLIREISKSGRAPKNSPAIFALALGTVSKDIKVRQHAFAIVRDVCRTSTHLFEFVDTCRKLGKGFGRGMKNAIADWYNNKSDDQLAYQLIKYRQREGYTHERLIRLSHPSMQNTSPARSAMYDWLRGRPARMDLPVIVRVHNWAMVVPEREAEEVVHLVELHELPWEALPTWANTNPEIWRAQLPFMGLNALMRNLGNMTRLGVFDTKSPIYANTVTDRLISGEEIRKSRLHPFNILTAKSVYDSGKGFRGTNSWEPIGGISEVLETCFYRSFQNITPSNKRILIALDVSGSMDSPMNNSPLTVREASSAMAMATMRTEEHCDIIGFTSLHRHNYGDKGVMPLNINPAMTLDQITRYTNGLPFGGTDCALPMLWALSNSKLYDAIIVYTDNETWAGNIHPVEALRQYRNRTGIDAKLIVVGMTSNGFSIADPGDHGMLDVVGFDTSSPSVISNFIAGDLTKISNSENEEGENL